MAIPEILASLGIAVFATAAPASSRATSHARQAPSAMSVGSPTDGHLENAVPVEASSSLRIVPAFAPRDVRWGLPDLVRTIERAAAAVAKRFPGSVMTVGDLSRRHGGEVDRHVSHESGRDADLGFYVIDEKSKPVLGEQFVAFDAQGRGKGNARVRFDDARNWAMIAALLSGPAQVQYLFIASSLRHRLLAEAARVHAPIALRTRAAELMVEPRGVLPHDDHVHVRIHCPASMKGCIDWPTTKSGALARRKSAGKNVHRIVAPAAATVVPLALPESPDDSTARPSDNDDALDDADGELSARSRAGR